MHLHPLAQPFYNSPANYVRKALMQIFRTKEKKKFSKRENTQKIFHSCKGIFFPASFYPDTSEHCSRRGHVSDISHGINIICCFRLIVLPFSEFDLTS